MFINLLGSVALCLAIGLPFHLITVGILQIQLSSYNKKNRRILIRKGYIALISGIILLTVSIAAVSYFFIS